VPTVTLIGRDGEAHCLGFQPGDTLMVLAVRNAVRGIEARCGGSLSCGTCAVSPDAAWRDRLAPMTADEREMLEFTGRDPETARLSCQLALTGALDGLRAAVLNNDID
jgi:2Fe-2S ferredoxin